MRSEPGIGENWGQTYGVGVPGFAVAYMQAVWEHDWMQAWVEAAEDEEWVIEQFDAAPAAK